MQDMAGWIAMKPEFHGQSLHVLQIPSFILGPKHSGKCSTLLGAGPMYNRFRDSHYSRIDRYELHILISSGTTHHTSVTLFARSSGEDPTFPVVCLENQVRESPGPSGEAAQGG